jgi:4-amino-4-deoxyprephenate dehydrogenase
VNGHRCVVVGGAGAVGAFFAETLRDTEWEVRVSDVAAPSRGSHIGSDARDPSPELVAALVDADAVIVATPEAITFRALPRLTSHMRDGALLVDTASVKSNVVERASALCVRRLEYVSVNPMFGPSLPAAGRAVAAVPVHEGVVWHRMRDGFRQRGMRVVEVDAETHDRVTAVTQCLTHVLLLAFGAALTELDVDLSQAVAMAPPPFTTTLAMLSRLCAGSPETYWEIQRANRYADASRAALAAGLRRAAATAVDDDGAEFRTLAREVAAALRPVSEAHARLCQQLYLRASVPAESLPELAQPKCPCP